MLELLLCSMLTILPDYLFRRYVQGKRFGKEITLYSSVVRAEVGHHDVPDPHGLSDPDRILQSPGDDQRYALLQNHSDPSRNQRSSFRSLSRLQRACRKGAPIFKLDSSKQEAAVKTARRKIAEVESDMVVARLEVTKAEHQIDEAKANYQQALDELETKTELQRRNSGTVPEREIERLQVLVQGRSAAVNSAMATRDAAQEKLSTQLPADKASAEAALAQDEVDLSKTVIRAGVSGRVEQFTLRVGDVVNPLMRPAGVLIPDNVGRYLTAGFDQIEAQIMKVGMIAEVTCITKPFVIIPMVVTDLQEYIPAGQFRGGEQLLDPQQVTRPGTLIAFLEPLYKGGMEDVTPGSSCIANAYSSNHDEIVAPETGTLRRVALHVVDGLALVHAILLRIQALLLPFKTLVFGGH